MNPQNQSTWPPPPAGGGPSQDSEHVSGPPRQPASFGPNQPSIMHQPQPSQINGTSILNQSSGPFFSSQSNGHNLPNTQALPQAPPLQPVRGPPPPQQHSPPIAQRVVQHPGYSFPTLGPAPAQQQSPQSAANAERERDFERDRLQHEMMAQARYEQETEVLLQQRDQQIREMRQQEQIHREQQQRELLQREQLPSPRENHIGTIPIQQPIASRVPATLHGPNGILNDQHAGVVTAPPQPSIQLGPPSGPSNILSNGAPPPNDNSLRPIPPQVAQNVPPQQLLGFNNAMTPQQLPNGVASISQGQQPILNDALSYLDQVKVRFVHQPDVYNQFLDIMKDFKSQAIDTPGVIERVSSLFAGHPELIQGFNTFLPPGYRIECGTADDPNAIRVTTPLGTTVSQMPAVQRRVNGLPNGIVSIDDARQGGHHEAPQTSIEWQASQNDEDASNSLLAHARRGGHQLLVSQDNPGDESAGPFERDDQMAGAQTTTVVHQQDQRGVSHLSNAVSAVTTNGAQGRHGLIQVLPNGDQLTSINQAAAGINGAISMTNAQMLEKRGPVEFNHAIGYVNKIKNRFALQPEIYKQFLEILQTYQRESKPIQDVYGQVTQLFSSAPDLLEDFKQFLPESAAQAKAQAAARQATEEAAMLSNVRGEYAPGAHQAQVQTPKPELKMPPVGSFLPPSATKENKKRRGGPGSQLTGGAAAVDVGAASAGHGNRVGGRGNTNKRARVEQTKPAAPEIPPISPTLVPSLPTPLPPSKDVSNVTEQIHLFERIKKHVSDKKIWVEFIKLCNLFTMNLIDKNILMQKAHGFIGGNPEITNLFKKFIEYNGQDDVIENKPKIPQDKVVLSNCRGLGPSYRLLPVLERLKPCAGRDETCKQVLNDDWASHPTWASEDSGFIAHRKNAHEEALHRIEEERHDYDINIEACMRTIQLLEPIVQQLQTLPPNEKAAYVLPAGIGGQSETIYQRVIKKIYDRERGCKVIEDMFKRPSVVLPILLRRIKEKVEEWKASQREWEKVWREQTSKIFWKSLDHQGIAAKKEDKRQLQPKTLTTEIQVKYEEQRRQRLASRSGIPKYQLEYTFKDVDVIYDTCHLIMTHLHYSHHANEVDKTRLETFITTFIPTFFDIDRDDFQERMNDVYDDTPPNEEAEDDNITNDDTNSGRGRKNIDNRKQNLLRGVLERGRQGLRDENMLDSQETSPERSHDEDMPVSTGTPSEHTTRVDEAEIRWMSHPTTGSKAPDRNVPFKRDNFHLYASSNIYCFFRVFQMLYERLLNIKSNEEQVKLDVQRGEMEKSAQELNFIEKRPSDFFADVSPSANYYRQVLTMCEDVVKQQEEAVTLEETLRRFYMQKGWLLVSLEKMLSSLVRFALIILVSDNKDKSLDIINLFYKDRKEDETTHQAELTYRKQVEKLAKDGDVYRIRYNRSSKTAFIKIFKKDEKTYEADELAAAARWSYYISTFTMRDRTEGVPLSQIRWPFLKRNMPPMLGDEEDYTNMYGTPQWNEDGLIIRISQDNYRLLYDPGTSEWWVHNNTVQKRGLGGYEEARIERGEKYEGLFGKNGKLLAARDGEQLEKEDIEFQQWVQGEPATITDTKEEKADGDEVMAGT